MPTTPLPDDEHATRYVSHLAQRRDGDGNVVGLEWHAFELRAAKNETYLSINCLERAAPIEADALRVIRAALAAKKLRAPDAIIAIGNVAEIKAAFGAKAGVRVTHEPSGNDPTYGAVRRLPLERRVALEKLASSHWARWVHLKDC